MNRQRPSLRELAEYFVRLGATGFGGPIALVGYMERDIVERRQWVTRQEFSDGLAFSQLAPGPLAAQLAIYLGWLCRGARGATAVGIAFIMPSFLMVVALAALYLRLGGMAWLRGAFYGVGAAVIAIIAKSSVKLARSTLGRDWLMWALFATSAVVTAWRESEVVWLFVASGVVALVLRTASASSSRQAWSVAALWLGRRPDWLDGGVQGVASLSIAGALFLYFTAAGMFVFG